MKFHGNFMAFRFAPSEMSVFLQPVVHQCPDFICSNLSTCLSQPNLIAEAMSGFSGRRLFVCMQMELHSWGLGRSVGEHSLSIE